MCIPEPVPLGQEVPRTIGDPLVHCEAVRSLTGQGYEVDDELERARARKKHFDQLYSENDKGESMWTDPSKTYTMEFLQHLFDYQKFTIDLGTLSYDMNDVLQGQPLQFMASHGENCDKLLWSFELWNQGLLEDAYKHASTPAPSDD